MAENYVQVCGTVIEARSALTTVEQTGHLLDELREKVGELWSVLSKEEKTSKFISLTNEEMVVTFVVDCGDYE